MANISVNDKKSIQDVRAWTEMKQISCGCMDEKSLKLLNILYDIKKIGSVCKYLHEFFSEVDVGSLKSYP